MATRGATPPDLGPALRSKLAKFGQVQYTELENAMLQTNSLDGDENRALEKLLG